MRKTYAESYPNTESLDAALDLLSDLSEEELTILLGAIKVHRHLESIADENGEYQPVAISQSLNGNTAVRLEWKKITRSGKKHGPYPYLRWFQNGVHKSRYAKRRK